MQSSPESSTVVAALVLNNQVNTNESFERSQRLLKQLLRRELVEKASGAIRPKLSRYANLLFFMEDGRLYLDENEQPVFRPGSDDGTVLSLQAMVSQKLIQSVREETKTKDSSLSVQLLEEVLGYGTTKEVESLRNLELLSRKIHANHESKRDAINENFLNETANTTKEQLLESKTKLQDELRVLQDKLNDENAEIEQKQKDLKDLESNFRTLISSLNLEGDLFDVDTLLQEDTDFSVILQAYVDRFELLKSKEKAENESITNLNNFKEQRLRFDAMLQTNEAERDQLLAEIGRLEQDILRCTNEKLAAETKKKLAEDKKIDEESKKESFEKRKEKFDSLARHELNVISSNVEVKTQELQRIENEVETNTQKESVGNLQRLAEDLSEAHDDVEACERIEGDYNTALTNARSYEDSARKEWLRLCTEETHAKNRYYQTDAKIKDGKSEKDNPQKAINKRHWDSITHQKNHAKRVYDSAISVKNQCESSHRSAVSQKEQAVKNQEALRIKKAAAVTEVQKILGELKNKANTDMQNSMREIEVQKIEINSQSETIENRANDILNKQKDIETANAKVKEKNKLISVLEQQVKKLMDKETINDSEFKFGLFSFPLCFYQSFLMFSIHIL